MFPNIRLRRNRKSPWIRELLAETSLNSSDLIMPFFVIVGENKKEVISSLPNQFRFSIDLLVKEVSRARDLGIKAIMLFPATPSELKTDDGRESTNSNNLICQAVRAIKENVPEIGIICDVALDPYTTHGHDGILPKIPLQNNDTSDDALGDPRKAGRSECSVLQNKVSLDPRKAGRSECSVLKNKVSLGRGECSALQNNVLNDQTVEILCQQALVQAKAGCDIVAPSDMMDGRVGAIRKYLDENGFDQVGIMSYSAKYASNFYGAFREAVGSVKNLSGDKKNYQMDFRNSSEAMREIELDIAEGADSLIIKPGLPYLDIVSKAAQKFDLPIISYQVSGEYAMLKLAADKNLLNFEEALFETLIAFKRAGASAIITYGAMEMAKILNNVS